MSVPAEMRVSDRDQRELETTPLSDAIDIAVTAIEIIGAESDERDRRGP